MNIVILGAGRVGESVAESLASERNDITVIDTDPKRVSYLQDRMDIRGVTGNGIEPSVMRDSGIEDADMFIACAPQDETNLVACKVAHDLFGVPTTIARVRSEEFKHGSSLLNKETGFAVDQIICPEQSLTAYIRKLIEYPEALQVLEFAGGVVSMVAVRAVEGSPLASHTLSEIPRLVPDVPMRVVAIYRQDKALAVLNGATRIEPGDEVFVLAAAAHIRSVLAALHMRDREVRAVMIAGGGKVGLRLAREVHEQYNLKIIESNAARCEYLASQLPNSVLVLNGDSTDESLMEDENVADMDLFVALTSDDEDNILACLLAKRQGARRVLALINRKAYADLVQGTQIDIAVSPAHTVIGELLAFVRRGDVEAVHSLRRGAAEVLELVLRGDARTCKVVGRTVQEIKLPEGTRIGAIVRGAPELQAGGEAAPAHAGNPQVILPHHDTRLLAGDHVIVFVPRKRLVREVEKLFQVSATFLF